jgi:hypothetical protein
MPRTVIKEAGWGRSQRFPERGLPMMIKDKADVHPRSEHHDLTEKDRRVFKRCASRPPPANAPSDGSQPFRIVFCCQHALHNDFDA